MPLQVQVSTLSNSLRSLDVSDLRQSFVRSTSETFLPITASMNQIKNRRAASVLQQQQVKLARRPTTTEDLTGAGSTEVCTTNPSSSSLVALSVSSSLVGSIDLIEVKDDRDEHDTFENDSGALESKLVDVPLEQSTTAQYSSSSSDQAPSGTKPLKEQQQQYKRPKIPLNKDTNLKDIYASDGIRHFVGRGEVACRGHMRLITSMPQLPVGQLRHQWNIGEGSFGSISCVTVAGSGQHGFAYLHEGDTKPSVQRRSSTKSNASYKNGGPNPSQKDSSSPSSSTISNLYVAKKLLDCGGYGMCTMSNRKYVHAATDLITEAHFLAGLQHPHIVELKGVASLDTLAKDYFFVMESLSETLCQRIHCKWSKRQRRLSKLEKTLKDHALFVPSGLTKKTNKRSIRLWSERVSVARDIMSALMFMHSENVLHRDIKPKNIGFDADGTVKLFDFGTCIELPSEEGTKLSGSRVGSRRYMAPEVFARQAYDTSADIYSFALVLWEMLMLDKPKDWNSGSRSKLFGGIIAEDDHENVSCVSVLADDDEDRHFSNEHHSCRERPSIPLDWSVGMRSLLSLGWSYHAEDRLSADQVLAVLKEELNRCKTSSR